MYKIVIVHFHNYLIASKTKYLILSNISFDEIQEYCMDIADQNSYATSKPNQLKKTAAFPQSMTNKKNEITINQTIAKQIKNSDILLFLNVKP